MADFHMKKNLRLLLGTALLFGISTGIYEFVLPLFLAARGISYSNMGIIFASAGVVMLLARIYMGGLADSLGRKPLYGWALVASGSAMLFTPLLPALLAQSALKMVRELGMLTRETLFPVMLFENAPQGFLNRIGKYRGMEFLAQGGGTMLAGVAIVVLGAGTASYQLLFYVAGILLLLAAFSWQRIFHETEHRAAAPRLKLNELFRFDFHFNLRVILYSSIIFSLGLQLSHSFFLQLFFINRFGISAEMAAWLMVVHRLTIALPMLVVGHLPIRNVRVWYIIALLIQGATVTVSALLGNFWASAIIFLLHDFIGAGIWSPLQANLIQQYSRDASRALDVGKVLAWGSLGAIFGPLLAGNLAEMDVRLPFFCSGIIMALAAIPIFWLRLQPAEKIQKTQLATVAE